MRTPLTEALGLEVPVVSAPMAGVSGGALAAAVSAAGALGTVGVGPGRPPDWVREQQRAAAEGAKPYGVGLLAWALAEQADPGADALLDAVVDPGPDVAPPALVSVSYGDYARYVPRLREAGVTVATQAGTLEDALRAEDAGVDLVVARGGEGGGHGRDAVATLPLLQAVLDRVHLPVLAAGGIGSARGLAAVLAAGAAGAWVGTAFLTCRESLVSDSAVERLADADASATVYGTVFDRAAGAGWPEEFGGRALRNRFFQTWRGREGDLAADERAQAAYRAARESGDLDTLAVYVGEGVGLLDGRRDPAADVVRSLAGCADLLRAAAEGLR